MIKMEIVFITANLVLNVLIGTMFLLSGVTI